MPVCVAECGPKLENLIGSIIYIDLVGQDEAVAREKLLAGVCNKPWRPTTAPIFPGEQAARSSMRQPPFPGSSSDSDRSLIQCMVPQIEVAFTKQDWLSVLQKANVLINTAPHALSHDIYRLQGLALLHAASTCQACEALEKALTLAHTSDQRLSLLETYIHAFVVPDQWDEALHYINEVLQIMPGDTHWLALRQEAQRHVSPMMTTNLTSSKTLSLKSTEAVEVFFSYSHRDRTYRDELDKHLSPLKRLHVITSWYDGEIGPGDQWADEVEGHLSQARVILLLVSRDFIASKYCYDIEMRKALERHEQGEARVIPVVLRPSYWELTPFGKLQALPIGGKPITTWRNHDEAWTDVVRGIQRAVDNLTTNKV